ncbi:hypothetical protein DPMN_104378 [Dreissena polymorpha]|uniref:Uncharacterized protein n=1 Tax=Dreissena polymorpha TaxID=45954 RepID=A0A9D4HCZ1_DREPO|nr:hypothetical protein DPMN_104378 [Dreissena polymorpha]
MLSKVSTKPLPTVKPTMTFQTPYKSHVPGQSSSTKPETEATVHKKKTAAPVFLHRGTNSDTDCKVNAETVPGVNKDCSGQGHIRNKSERLAVSNDGTPLSHGENRVLKQDSCADNVFSNLCSSLLMFDEQLSVRNETALKNENITRPGKNSVSKSPNAATETGNVSKSGLAVTVAMETNSVAWGQDGHHISGTMETDAPDPDEFSQDEGDVFYCMLVEARKHQEDIIKVIFFHRKKDFIIPCHMRRDIVLALSVQHFCVRSQILEALWRISLKLGMNIIYMDKRMMRAKWHCTPSVNNGVMALCILKKCFFVSRAISWKCFGGFH